MSSANDNAYDKTINTTVDNRENNLNIDKSDTHLEKNKPTLDVVANDNKNLENKNKTVETESDDVESVRIEVRSITGTRVQFKIKRSTPLGKLMKIYCKRLGQPLEAVRFLFDGCRISSTDTAVSLGLKENDVIDALIQQVGGSFSSITKIA